MTLVGSETIIHKTTNSSWDETSQQPLVLLLRAAVHTSIKASKY